MEFSTSSDGRERSAPVSDAPNWFEGHVLNPFVNGIGITPYNAVANAVNFATPGDLLGKAQTLPISQDEFLTPGWFVQNVSHGLGAITPYVVAGKAAGSVMRGTASRFALNGPTAGFLKSEIAAQTAGAAMLDFSRDTHQGETRLGNAIGGGVGMFFFAKGNVLTGAADNLLQRGATRFAVGSVGGMAGLTSSRLVSGESVSGKDLLKAGITGGTMNVALPPTQHAITKGFEKTGSMATSVWNSKPVKDVRNSNPVQSAYWSVRANTREEYTSVRQASHRFLNEHNLSHPLKRLLDTVSPREVSVIKPPLTVENNPILAFEKALPEYFKAVGKNEEAYKQRPQDRYELNEQLREVQGDFAAKLLEVWHGTADKPGMKHYTDAELANSTTSVERVAQIRSALTQNTRRDAMDQDRLADALAELAPKELTENLRSDNYGMNNIELGREKFYGYDHSSIGKMMTMPRMHEHRDTNNYNTPNEWMPYDATPLLANLFHGSMSQSLPSVFREGKILSSHELRLRGLNQNSGESAGHEFPQRSISITRDFNEAYAYHRHSPSSLTDFPVVFGVSKDVASRINRAGFLEPGELLISRLGIGHSILTRLGLRKPDVTNIYVPDGEVANVTQQLWANRITGINVVGFNQIPQPKWHPEPTVQEMIEMGYR